MSIALSFSEDDCGPSQFGATSGYQVARGPCGPVYQIAAGIDDTRPAERHSKCDTGYTKKVGHVARAAD